MIQMWAKFCSSRSADYTADRLHREINTVSTVGFIRVVTAVVVSVAQVPFWNTQSAGRTLELTFAASCNMSKHVIYLHPQFIICFIYLLYRDILTEIKRNYKIHSCDFRPLCCFNYTVSRKNLPPLNFVTLSNRNRFSKILHCLKAYEICYKNHKNITHLTLGMLLHYPGKLEIQIFCRYSADMEENANNLHFKCTYFNSIVYAECIYVLTK